MSSMRTAQQQKELDDLGDKWAAEILLISQNSKIIIPEYHEWIGVNLLDKDSELKSQKKGKGVK